MLIKKKNLRVIFVEDELKLFSNHDAIFILPLFYIYFTGVLKNPTVWHRNSSFNHLKCSRKLTGNGFQHF